MNKVSLVSNIKELLAFDWPQFKPIYDDLEKTELSKKNIKDWLKNWTAIGDIRDELYNRLFVATSINTADQVAQDRFEYFMNEIYPNAMAAEQGLKKKLLTSELTIPGLEIPLRNMRAQSELFRL